MLHTDKHVHINPEAKRTRKVRTFPANGYPGLHMNEIDRAAIAGRLRQARAEVALTQVEMAELLTVHYRTVQTWESPKITAIPFDQLDQWAQITGRTKEWLLHGDEPRIVADDRLQEIEDELRRLATAVERFEDLLRELNADAPFRRNA